MEEAKSSSKLHNMSPGVWHDQHKYTFYRIQCQATDRSPLHLAAEKGHEKVVVALIESKAKICADEHGYGAAGGRGRRGSGGSSGEGHCWIASWVTWMCWSMCQWIG